MSAPAGAVPWPPEDIDLRDGLAGAARPVADLVADVAACLERFLDATADETVLLQARGALDAWRSHLAGDAPGAPSWRPSCTG